MASTCMLDMQSNHGGNQTERCCSSKSSPKQLNCYLSDICQMIILLLQLFEIITLPDDAYVCYGKIVTLTVNLQVIPARLKTGPEYQVKIRPIVSHISLVISRRLLFCLMAFEWHSRQVHLVQRQHIATYCSVWLPWQYKPFLGYSSDCHFLGLEFSLLCVHLSLKYI